MYKHSNNKSMTSGAIAAMLSTILYGRRFFPYYVYNIIGGLDEEGKWRFYNVTRGLLSILQPKNTFHDIIRLYLFLF